jgi:hypothetical protein
VSDSPERTQATPKERNDLLVDQLKEYYSGVIDFEFKHTTVLALIGGWLLSSETARKTLAADRVATAGICVMVLMLTVLHAAWVRRYYVRSASAYARIAELKYIDTRDVESRRIPSFTRWSFTLIHFVISVVICGLALRT